MSPDILSIMVSFLELQNHFSGGFFYSLFYFDKSFGINDKNCLQQFPFRLLKHKLPLEKKYDVNVYQDDSCIKQ